MANDEFHNSTGYFKDPGTGHDLTGDEPRATTCHPGEPFNWPMIALSDGNIVKLCSRLWNVDEKQCYKEYRNGGTCVKSERIPRERKQREPKSVIHKAERVVSEQVEEQRIEVVKYDHESAVSAELLKVIAESDCIIGVSQIAGLTYALVTKIGSKTVHHIPRACIPDAEFDRLYRRDE